MFLRFLCLYEHWHAAGWANRVVHERVVADEGQGVVWQRACLVEAHLGWVWLGRLLQWNGRPGMGCRLLGLEAAGERLVNVVNGEGTHSRALDTVVRRVEHTVDHLLALLWIVVRPVVAKRHL